MVRLGAGSGPDCSYGERPNAIEQIRAGTTALDHLPSDQVRPGTEEHDHLSVPCGGLLESSVNPPTVSSPGDERGRRRAKGHGTFLPNSPCFPTACFIGPRPSHPWSRQ